MKLNRWVHEELIPSDDRYLLCQGGAGSGKSVGIAQKLLLRGSMDKGHRFLICRKVATTIKSSVFKLFKDIIYSEGKGDFYKFNNSEYEITDLITGSEFLFKGLDDVEKLKSITGISGVWFEEATEGIQDDFDQLELRVRGDTPSYKQFILSYNPISEDNWINKRFFTRDDSEVKVIKTNYQNNAFLDDDYINHLNTRVKHDENLYRIYVLGEWGRIKTGAEFYKAFEVTKHVKENIKYNPDIPLHISFDENVNPYITLTVWQIEGKKAVQIDEVCLESPRNNLRYLCAEFKKRFKGHVAGLFVYGDATSRKQDTKLEKGYNFYRMVADELKQYNPQMRVPKKNPPVAKRGEFINAVFGSSFQEIEIYISDKCYKTREDYLNVLEAPDGTKHKAKTTDSKSGIRYEKHGHTSDANDYLICQVFKDDFSTYINGVKDYSAYTLGDYSFNNRHKF